MVAEKIAAFRTLMMRQVGPFPIYVYTVAGVVFVGAVIYFKRKGNTGSASAAPQTNYPTSDTPPMPYPGAGSPGVPPTSAFDTSGASLPNFPTQDNFTPPNPTATQSQDFGSAVSVGNGSNPAYSGYDPARSNDPSYGRGYATPAGNTTRNPLPDLNPTAAIGDLLGRAAAAAASVARAVVPRPQPAPQPTPSNDPAGRTHPGGHGTQF